MFFPFPRKNDVFSLSLLKPGLSVGSTRKSLLQPSHLISTDFSCRQWKETGSFWRQWGQQINSLFRNNVKRLPSAQSTSGNQLGQAEVGLSKCPPSPPCLYTPPIVIYCLSLMYLHIYFFVILMCPLSSALSLCSVVPNCPIPMKK